MQSTAPEKPRKPPMSLRRRHRIALWTVAGLLALSVVLPLVSYSVHWLGSTAVAQEVTDTNPRSNYWRAVREGVAGTSTVKGSEANVLVQAGGTNWTRMRNGPVAEYLPWALAGMFGILLLYHLIHGRNKLDASSLSGRRVPRWNMIDRTVHWVTAISFIALTVTGLSMLIGRSLLIPLLGKEGFALWAQASIAIHNFVGPVFSVGVCLMIVMWIWHNFPNRVDLQWLKKGGGVFANNHPSAGRMNAGEKLWFWLMCTLGVAVIVTGLLLVKPIYGIVIPGIEADRLLMQQSNLIHAVGSILWAAVALGHIYIGTAGTEGAIEGMAKGHVSEEWARQHHDLWFEDMERKGKVVAAGELESGSTTSVQGGSGQPAAAS